MGLSDLITHEDPYHIHKSLGAFVIAHYFYQFIYYYHYQTMELTFINMLPHLLLHISSFVFRVLHNRMLTEKLAMFIWEELRFHSMIFAYRSCFSILLPSYRVFFVFLTMAMADLITFLIGNPDITTIRGSHDRVSSKSYKHLAAAFYCSSQFGATLICGGFFQDNYSRVLAFSTLPAIQTSAFGMTLIRKNVINKTVWQIVYSAELLLVYYMWYLEYNNFAIVYLSAFCYTLRKMGTSKYFLFLLITIADYLWRKVILLDDITYDHI